VHILEEGGIGLPRREAVHESGGLAKVAITTEKLSRPSVVEAVCEFRFARGVSYTLIPGGMRERLRGTFSSYEVLPVANFLGPLPEEMALPPMPHHRFRSQPPNSLVQTGPRLLTVNVLPVYPTFEVFRELILGVLQSYRDVAESGDPVSVGLRYINHIPRAEGGDSISSYVRCSIDYPAELPHPPQESAARVVVPYPEVGSLSMAVSFPAQVGTGEIGALLDLAFTRAEPSSFDKDKFPDWLDRAHDIIYAAFTSTLLEPILAARR